MRPFVVIFQQDTDPKGPTVFEFLPILGLYNPYIFSYFEKFHLLHPEQCTSEMLKCISETSHKMLMAHTS